jgi:hypothetical protein
MSLAGIDEAGVGIHLPEIYRLRGECLLALDRNNKAQARSTFATAANIASRQGAVIFERRAEASLSEFATLRCDQSPPVRHLGLRPSHLRGELARPAIAARIPSPQRAGSPNRAARRYVLKPTRFAA